MTNQEIADDLMSKIRDEKRVIRETRRSLRSHGRDLSELREKCKEFGIELIEEHPSEEEPHGST